MNCFYSKNHNVIALDEFDEVFCDYHHRIDWVFEVFQVPIEIEDHVEEMVEALMQLIEELIEVLERKGNMIHFKIFLEKFLDELQEWDLSK